jgi:hypothetical protein
LEWICLGNQPFNLPPVSWLTLLRFLCRVRRRITAAGKCDGRSKQWVTWLLTMFFYTCGWMYSFFFTEDGCIRSWSKKKDKKYLCICLKYLWQQVYLYLSYNTQRNRETNWDYMTFWRESHGDFDSICSVGCISCSILCHISKSLFILKKSKQQQSYRSVFP